MPVILVILLLIFTGGGMMIWNNIADNRVTQFDERAPRDPETGILIGGEARRLGPEDTDKAILFVHGFSGTPNNFADLPDQVAAAGWRVHAMLLPGHGTTPRDFEKTSARELEQAVRDELAALREQYATVVLLGHSMGGALATIVAANTDLDGLILMSPYYRVTHQWYYVLRPETWTGLLSPLLRWVYRSPAMQPVNRVEAKEKILSYAWISTKAARTAMFLASKADQDPTLTAIKAPVLLMHSKRDTVTDPTSSAAAFEKLTTENKRAVWLSTSNHILFWDFERDKVAREVLTFLEDLDDDEK